jgi:hypothetical protein
LQPLVGGGQLDLLALPLGVDATQQLKGAEDGEQASGVQFVQAADSAAIVEGDGLTKVAWANESQEGAKEEVAQLEQLLKEGAFDLVGGGAGKGGLVQGLDEGLEARLDLWQQPLDGTGDLGLVLLRGVCQHGESLLCGIRDL